MVGDMVPGSKKSCKDNFLIFDKKVLEQKNAKQVLYNLQINGLGYDMRVRASVKADPSKGDKVVRRKGRIYVLNEKDPTRKQRQKGPARKK